MVEHVARRERAAEKGQAGNREAAADHSRRVVAGHDRGVAGSKD